MSNAYLTLSKLALDKAGESQAVEAAAARSQYAIALALIGIGEILETLAGTVALDAGGEPAVKTITIYAQRMRAHAESREDKRARCEATHRHSVQWPRSESGCPGELPPRGVRPGEDAGGPCQ